jgi:hypothetical protein
VLTVFVFPQETRVCGAHEEVSDRIPVQRMPASVSDPLRPDLRHRSEDVQQRLFLGNGELPVPVAGQQTVSRSLRAAHRRAQKLFVLILHNIIIYYSINSITVLYYYSRCRKHKLLLLLLLLLSFLTIIILCRVFFF